MDNQEQDIVERLKKANNILVTVSNSPSVDQLAACIGLTIALNKLDKHATAVFSGEVPSTIEFLQPEETLEKNTDSLRDFIISLDKSKADKLRYKVEDRVVRIFITPYKTSISDSDLEFSQGDFNVDVVLAIGVHQQKDLDQAITAHGRIMHDATVITVNNESGADLGSINWLNTSASSLSEMGTTLINLFNLPDLLDQQIATAFLTGIVAETERFSNDKTTANTMNASAALMAAGANQQLVAQKLQEPAQQKTHVATEPLSDDSMPTEPEKLADVQISEDGTLEIDHDSSTDDSQQKDENKGHTAESQEELPLESELPKIEVDTPIDSSSRPEPNAESVTAPAETRPAKAPANYDNPRTAISTAPVTSQPAFTSAVEPENDEALAQYANPLNLPPIDPQPPIQAISEPVMPPLTPVTPVDHSKDTLQDLEQELHSPHLDAPMQEKPVSQNPLEELDLQSLQRPSGLDEEPVANLNAARDAVAQAVAGQSTNEVPEALNSNIMVDNLHPTSDTPAALSVPTPTGTDPNLPPMPGLETPLGQPMTMPLPPFPGQQATPPPPADNRPSDPNDPPDVPPPITAFPR